MGAPIQESNKWEQEVSKTFNENITRQTAIERKQRQLTINKRNRLRGELESPKISASDIVLPPYRPDVQYRHKMINWRYSD